MSELQSRTGFDQRERELVRSALRRYMEESGIGTPTLQYRIIETDPRRREIPLSTLQRFITGAHHTQDHHVALCHAFARILPYYGEGRDIAEVGTALTKFFNAPMRFDASKAMAVMLAEKVAGEFEGRAKERRRGPPLPGRERKTVLWSSLSLNVVPEQPFLAASELVMDIIQGRDRRYAYEGVLISVPPQLYAVLRSSLTRRPKIYSFEAHLESAQDTVAVLGGHGFEIDLLRLEHPSLYKSFGVAFRRQRREG